KVLKKIPSAKVIHPKAISFLDCLKYKPNVPKVSIDASEDPAILMMTGGTTGVPKAAILTNQNCVADSTTCVQALFGQKIPGRKKLLGYKTGMFGVLPLFHSFAMSAIMNTSIIMGGWIMLFPKPPPTEELLTTFNRLPNYNGYVYIAAEILFKRIADLPKKIIDRYQIAGKLELCISGAGPLHEYVRIPFEKKTGAKIREGYGLTEASPVVSCNNFFGDLDPGTVGVPFPGIDWQIFPSDNFDKGPIEISGEEGTGEICISGPIVMKGYYNQPEQTAETIKEWNGRKWLLTGDIGYLDNFGRIIIRDRKKQLIKMAGHSVFPKEVENLIGEHPDVLEVAVAGVPDRKTGEAVKAWIALKPESYEKISVEELKSWMVSNITHWKCPKYVEIVTTIPKSAIGKVMRRSLQESDPLWIEEHNKENSLENSGEELGSEQLSGNVKEAMV
ncbi:MAG: AMP-binding protein, partial [Promethearchaeota archaeon]